MAYYDRIADAWDRITGRDGGAFKKHALNERILARIDGVVDAAILDLGTGNGYFLPMICRHFRGQRPARIVATDISEKQLAIARRNVRSAAAEFLQMDVRARFPFADGSFDLILSTMVFNELSTPALRRALAECRRVLSSSGRLLVTVIHPALVRSLQKRGQLRTGRGGLLTMPATGGLRLPVFRRSVATYAKCLASCGFAYAPEEVFSNARVLAAKRGLRQAGSGPAALLFDCQVRALQ